jgi:nitroreductase
MEPDSAFYRRIKGLRAIRSFDPRPLDRADLEAIVDAGRWTGSSKNSQRWAVVVVDDPAQRQRLAACGDYTDPVRSAPVTLALVREEGGNDFDIGRLAQNLMLAASSRGVASCPITLHRSGEAAAVIELPDGKVVRYAVALGYPGPDPTPARRGGRKPASEFVHHNRYGRVSDS